ncbi:DUF4291 family protein [Escherichia albertii]|uniref:DUF4291 family protein n=1 Tax=Escherichia albertii TaxID=208962 RepID=UPI001374ECAC|nr:DUF4291 family protein [Escherichia albertii]
MADYFEIRADYNQHTITVYQAYNDAIANVAVRDGRFGAPFSFNRMTWIKPSSQAKSFLPSEKIYPVSAAARKALGMKNY